MQKQLKIISDKCHIDVSTIPTSVQREIAKPLITAVRGFFADPAVDAEYKEWQRLRRIN